MDAKNVDALFIWVVLQLFVLSVLNGVYGATEGDLRLVIGSRIASHDGQGNVEIFHAGKWGAICDDEWDIVDAGVVCRHLGFNGTLQATTDAFYGKALRPIVIDNLYCTGTENTLSQCPFDGWGVHDCGREEAAGVKCMVSATPATSENAIDDTINIIDKTPVAVSIRSFIQKDVKLRLLGGRSKSEGRVEVDIGRNSWGILCGDGFGLLEAAVVCRQLGLGFAREALRTNFFGGNVSRMSLAGVKCTGDEENLADCLHQPGIDQCPQRSENIAGVMCTDELPDLVIDERELERSTYLEDRQLLFLQCAMEENCVSSSAYNLRHDPGWLFERRRLLRFTARVGNVGMIPFRPFLPKDAWLWHACHMHYHSMEVFAHYDVIDSKGKRVAEGHKASFCLEDNHCADEEDKTFACADYGDQGISVGCTDTYLHNIDCQWVDMTDVAPGYYQFRVSINPEYKMAEITFDNNAATCNLLYTEQFAIVSNCTLGRP